MVGIELNHFSLTSIPGIDAKRKIIERWIAELHSGRISQSKEEEIKPRFLDQLFGDVLGYSFNGANSWNGRPEFKSLVDATKADAALGFFVLTQTGVVNEVMVVVEIKDFSTDLDNDKNSKQQTAIDQAFSYAHKTKASWVIISNFQEVRLYSATFSAEYEVFQLKDLNKDDEMKRFMMLLHRQSLMEGRKSRVTKLYELQQGFSPGLFSGNQVNPEDHIIDQLWKSLKRFDGLESIDPYIIANIQPFNILDEYVWHYENFRLFTLNPKIYALLRQLNFQLDGRIDISDALAAELESKKIDKPSEKLEFIFNKLRVSLVYYINAVSNYEFLKSKNSHVIGYSVRHPFHFSEEEGEGISKKIEITSSGACECINCLFRSFDFKTLLRKLKQKAPATLELAYGHYLVATDGYKRCFELYETIISETDTDSGKRTEHFIANYNQQLLFNLISWYDDPDRDSMLKKLKSIDLDELIYTKFNQSDRDVRESLKEIRDDRVALRVKKNIDELLESLREAKRTYDRGGNYGAIPNYTFQLHFYLCHYYAFIQKNYLTNGAFTNYQNTIQRIIEGLLISYGLKQYPYRLQHFALLHLMEATLFVPTDKLEKLLENIQEIEVNADDLKAYLMRLKMFLSSHVDDGIFDRVSLNQLMAEALITGHFKDTCSRIFGNVFLFLTKINLDTNSWDAGLNTAIIKFLKAQNYLYWYQVDKLGKFIKIKGFLFSPEQLKTVLSFANKMNGHDDNTYQRLIRNSAKALQTWFPDVRMDEESFVLKAISDAQGGHNHLSYTDLISIFNVVSKESQEKINAAIDSYLERRFDSACYESCVFENIFEVNHKDYFEKYVQAIAATKGKGLVKIENHIPDFQDFIFYNFIILVRRSQVSAKDPRLSVLTNLSNYEQWLINPDDFNYDFFDPEWLIASNQVILETIRHIPSIRKMTYEHLQKNYSDELSKIYFGFLAGERIS